MSKVDPKRRAAKPTTPADETPASTKRVRAQPTIPPPSREHFTARNRYVTALRSIGVPAARANEGATTAEILANALFGADDGPGAVLAILEGVERDIHTQACALDSDSDIEPSILVRSLLSFGSRVRAARMLQERALDELDAMTRADGAA